MRGVCRGRRIYEALILHALESVNEGEEEAEEEKTRLFGLTISPFAPDFSLHVESTTWAYNVGAVNKPHLHIRINKTDGPICMLSAFNLFLFFFLFFYSNEPWFFRKSFHGCTVSSMLIIIAQPFHSSMLSFFILRVRHENIRLYVRSNFFLNTLLTREILTGHLSILLKRTPSRVFRLGSLDTISIFF